MSAGSASRAGALGSPLRVPRVGALRLLVLVLASAGLAASLLSLRQARLQAAHELTRSRLRLIDLDNRLLAVRGEIAALSTPAVLAEGPLQDPGAWVPDRDRP